MAEERKKEMSSPEKGISRRDFLKGAAGATASLGLAAITGCVPKELITPTPETPTPTPQPTEVPTPTQEIRPTPTIAPIEITPREIGGVTGEKMVVEYNGESQKLFKYTLSNGETFFLLGYYPKLPGISERTDLGNEVVYYDGQPFVFLTAMASLEGDHEALPFYDRKVPEVGILRWLENGEAISQQSAFEQLQEGEVSVQFPGNGNYEFLDKEGKILRTKEIFKPVEVAPVIEGLVFNPQDGKYYVEAGNPYGLEVGVYAGEKIEYNRREETGVVLIPAVVRILMEQANTPEAIAKGEWKIPFPLDPRGEENLVVEEWRPGILSYVEFGISGISPEAKFINPFPQPIIADWAYSPHTKSSGICILVPEHFSGDNTWYIGIGVPEGTKGPSEGETIPFGAPIHWGIETNLEWHGKPLRFKALVLLGPQEINAKSDFNITDNILETDDTMVFLARST